MLQLVPTPIGNIADITLRAMSVLGEADVLLCEDTRVTKQLLHILKERYNLQTKPNQSFIALHSHNEEEFLKELTPDFFDQNVVYVSDAGMPCISDPGMKLVAYAQSHDIEYDVLPGANAALTAFAASGFDQTQFCFFGFLPHKGKERLEALQKALGSGYITILYESPHRLKKLLQEIAEKEPMRELFVVKELTKRYQHYYRGDAKEILNQIGSNIKGEWVVLLQKSKKQKDAITISQEEIIQLDLPKKQKAKLLAKITGKSVKECYSSLI
ncbi:rRNA small subunit methyltransferase I [hydrothermal vent metagenome]|uniref:rRNA small subunit methyltransferase I n=1 Tax=hydrothermal vent metagenome TaxID=652676 RepID=A0A1W1B8V2_9ZZZZ